MKFLNCILAGLLTIAQSQPLGASSLNQRQVQETQVTKTKEDAHAAIMDMYAATSSANAVRQQTTGSDIYELITTYEGGWIQDGVMFDVRAAPIAGSTASTSDENEGLVVLAFDILTPNKDEQVCVEIYTKQGTFEGHDTTQNSWTFLGSVSVLGQGKNKPTHIPIGSFDPTHIPLDATQAFYITTHNENMRYTAFKDAENKTGSVFVSENHSNQDSERGMSIEILTGVAKNYPFGESWPDRVFNGAMLYRLGNDLDMSSIFSEMSGKEVQESVAAKRGYATCDVDVAVDATVADQTTTKPTSEPNSAPTNVSTNVPTALPTNEPTTLPTKMPTKEPTSEPTLSPVPVTPTTSPTPVVRSVATTLHGGLKQAGMMFDVRVPSVEEGGPPEGLTVIAFEVSTFLTSDMCVEVYHKNGTHVGFETDVKKNEDGTWSSPSWRSIGAAATQGAGDDAPTHLPVGSVDQVFIPPGETHAFYVTMQTPELRYTQPKFGEKTGAIFSGSPDGHLELLVGAAKSYPFMDTWPDRIFNGAVLYHLGDVLDASEYGGLTADERNYSCSAPVAPTMRPTTDTLNSNATTPSLTRPPTALGSVSRPPTDPGANETRPSEGDASKPPTPAQTAATRPPSPSVVEDQVPASSPDASQTTRPRLVGSCPSSTDTTDSESSGQQAIFVQYEYELVTDLTVDLRDVILGIENVVHGNLIAQKCAQDRRKDLRMLQETSNTSTTSYLGFNSDPVDAATDKNCANVAALADNEVCTVIKGGLTASTKDGVDDTIVQEEINLFIEGLLSDSTNYDETGAKQVIVQSDDLGETGSGTDRGTDISEAQKEIDQGTATDGSDGLSTAATIAISVVGGVVLIALVLLLAMLQNRRKKVKMESMRELFDDEELEEESPAELGQGYSDNKDASYPSANNSSVASSSLFPPDDEEMTSMEKSSSPAVILNDQDEASLISNTESKMMPFHVAPQPVSSSIEKEQYGSVEFIRAGESFGSRARSYQPEDTVDL